MSAYLLDTNVAVWLLLGDRNAVPGRVAATLENTEHQVSLSVASVWEIAIKRSLGRLAIDRAWFPALLQLGFEVMPVMALHAAEVERLPWHHRDPFDRLLIAQARVERRTLVTADRRLAAYDVPVLW